MQTPSNTIVWFLYTYSQITQLESSTFAPNNDLIFNTSVTQSRLLPAQFLYPPIIIYTLSEQPDKTFCTPPR